MQALFEHYLADTDDLPVEERPADPARWALLIGVSAYDDSAIAKAQEITLQKLENRPLAIKLRDSFCHLFAPYL